MVKKDHIISGNNKDGFLLKCCFCGKEWIHNYPNQNCSDECYREFCRKRMKENNPLNDPKIREKQKLATSTPECKAKKRKFSLEHNPMNNPEVKEKHKNKMKILSGKNNPLYTSLNGLENLRKAERSNECKEKKRKNAKQAYIDGKHPMCFEENRIKISKANSKPYNLTKEYIEYNRAVNQETNISLIKHKNKILNYSLRGKKYGYELDHKFSIREGFEWSIDPKIIGHWKNLEIITRLENDIKYTKCSITIEELIESIDKWEMFND